MNASNDFIEVRPVGSWGRYKTWLAKVGTMPGSVILIKRARRFRVGQKIEFCDLFDLEGTSKAMTPKWKPGIISRIDDRRIILDFR